MGIDEALLLGATLGIWQPVSAAMKLQSLSFVQVERFLGAIAWGGERS